MHFSQSFVEASPESPEKVRKQSVYVQSEWHALQTGYLHSHLSAEVKTISDSLACGLMFEEADRTLWFCFLFFCFFNL